MFTAAENNVLQKTELKNKHVSFILRKTLMEVNGFTARNGMISINDTSGINAAINWDESDRLTYEIAIPFKEWFGPGYNNTDLLKDVSLTITINALKQKQNSGGEAYGGTGRLKSGGMHHQQNANSDVENQVLPGEYKYSLYEKRKLKQKFILAQSSDKN